MALILYRPLVMVLALCLVAYLVWLQRRLRLRWRPAWILRAGLVLLALAGLFFPQGNLLPGAAPAGEILVLDQSDSIPPETSRQMVEQARAWHAAQPNRVVIAAGAAPALVLEPGEAWPVVDGRISSLAQALTFARQVTGSAQGGRIILASDGLADDDRAVDRLVRQLAEQQVRLDVLPLAPRSDPADVYAGGLQAPAVLWENTPLDLVLPVYNAPGSLDGLSFQVRLNGQPYEAAPQPVGAGFYLFRLPAQPQGIVELSVQVLAQNDPFPENNSAHATLRIYPSPQALFVTAQPDERFTSLLLSSGLRVDSIAPEELAPEMMDLDRYQVIWINNVLSNRISAENMEALRAFVGEQGGGVIFVGGQNSYTLGGYKNTLLEPLFPVKLEPPEHAQKLPVVFLLVLDRSDSMDPRTGEIEIPITLAKEAAIRAVEMLDVRDMLGVLAYSTDQNWKMPIRALGDGIGLRDALDAISSISPFGGTFMYEALQEAVAAMQSVSAADIPQRNILLLTDGQSKDGSPEEFQALARSAREQGLVLSTIALGAEADLDLLRSIAEQGGGRFYAVQDAQDLPRIMMNESRAARSENVQLGLTSLQPGEPGHPLLSGLAGERLPATGGYNAVSSKTGEGAEDILVSSSFSDPILSAGQYGLGRVVAWTADLGQLWLQAWPAQADEGYFWSQVLRYALPNPAMQGAQVEVSSDGARITVQAAIQDAANRPANLLPVNFVYTSGENTARQIPLQQVQPGLYQLQLERFPEGTYRALVNYALPNTPPQEVLVPFAVNTPPEWLPASAQEQARGIDNLRAWAAATGGVQIQALDPRAGASVETPAPASRRSLQWVLLLCLVIGWPVEIAIRRRWLPWTPAGKDSHAQPSGVK